MTGKLEAWHEPKPRSLRCNKGGGGGGGCSNGGNGGNSCDSGGQALGERLGVAEAGAYISPVTSRGVACTWVG